VDLDPSHRTRDPVDRVECNSQFPLPQSALGFFRKTMLAFPNDLE
jgi:hypothetical protein